MKIFENKLVQRKMICITLGLLFGFLCVYFANSSRETSIWGTPLMWGILYNRVLIGIFVTFIGAFNWHGMFSMKYSAWFRGLLVGMVVSLDLAIGVFIATDIPEDQIKMAFWATILVGGIYGMIIDIVATRIAGDGKSILEGWIK